MHGSGATAGGGAETGVSQLRIGRGPWDAPDVEQLWTRCRASARTGIIVVGAGITGSLVAQHLTALGFDVTVIDRLVPGQGSTAASTAMLQWEIDRSLVELTEAYGFDKAAAVYRLSYQAVGGLGDLVKALGIGCAWRDRAAVYLAAAGATGSSLDEEHLVRRRAGLPGALLDGVRLGEAFGIKRPAAIVSPGSGECDPVQLANAMLELARRSGAGLIRDNVIDYDFDAKGARVALESGFELEGSAVILATGYVMPPFVQASIHRLSASWAAVTASHTSLAFWRERALIWEDDTPYLYARTTADDRILVGGEDETLDDQTERDARTPAKAAAMHRKLEALWQCPIPVFESAWSAEFGESEDGLPLIGPVAGRPNCYAAYGYGGNGITFSYMASRLLGTMLLGRREACSDYFALDRPPP